MACWALLTAHRALMMARRALLDGMLGSFDGT